MAHSVRGTGPIDDLIEHLKTKGFNVKDKTEYLKLWEALKKLSDCCLKKQAEEVVTEAPDLSIAVPEFVQDFVSNFTLNDTTVSLNMWQNPGFRHTLIGLVASKGRGADSFTQVGVTWNKVKSTNSNGMFTEVWVGIVSGAALNALTVSFTGLGAQEVAVVEIAKRLCPIGDVIALGTVTGGGGATERYSFIIGKPTGATTGLFKPPINSYVAAVAAVDISDDDALLLDNSSGIIVCNVPWNPFPATRGMLKGGLAISKGTQFRFWGSSTSSQLAWHGMALYFSCHFTPPIPSQTVVDADITFITNANPIGTDPWNSVGTAYFFLLDVTNQKLYQSSNNSSGVAQNPATLYSNWEEITLPPNPGGLWRRIHSSLIGVPVIFADNKKIATKQRCDTIGDPLPQTVTDFVAYDTAVQYNPDGGCGEGEPRNDFYPPNFGTPEWALLPENTMSKLSNAAYALAGSTEPPSPHCNSLQYAIGSRAFPSGTWHRFRTQEFYVDGQSFSVNNVLAVGVNKVARWYTDSPYDDHDWVLIDCPAGDWRDTIEGEGCHMIVGIGPNPIAYNLDWLATGFITLNPPAGVVCTRRPRIIWDALMYVANTQGAFIIIGMEKDNQDVVIIVPYKNDNTLDTPFIATLPAEVPADIKWQGITKPWGWTSDGVVIVGKSETGPANVYVLSNKQYLLEGTDPIYADWQLQILSPSNGPFV